MRYVYDSWGKLLSCTGSAASTIGELNPFRYRGYYWDAESGLYYLQSRYYDPETGRFVNADSVLGANDDMATYNLFAYCGNDPVNCYDDDGLAWRRIRKTVKKVARAVAKLIPIDTAASMLNMSKDSKGIYHAKLNCWQQYAGYNDVYDFAFNMVTSMARAKFQFSYSGTQYMLWAWKGDYLNLGAGAELGIYYGGGPHWLVDKGLAMNMSMTVKYRGSTIISWKDKTWWITGFNPRYQNVKANSLTVTFTVTFKNQGMYNAFMGTKPKGWKSAGGLSATYTF